MFYCLCSQLEQSRATVINEEVVTIYEFEKLAYDIQFPDLVPYLF